MHSEDKSVRIWDLRGNGRAVKHISGVFPGEDVATLAFHPANPHRLFAASGDTIVELDLRRPDVLLRDAAATWGGMCSDDVAHIVMDSSGDFLVAADDAGVLTVVDVAEALAVQTIAAHESLAACVAFADTGELVSGGYDATVRIAYVHVWWSPPSLPALLTHTLLQRRQ